VKILRFDGSFRVAEIASSADGELEITRDLLNRSAGSVVALSRGVMFAKRFVDVLSNHSEPARYYTGVTANVPARLRFHNAGLCRHTAGGRPWRVDVVVQFADERRALTFERYLKSGSGVAFAKRHLR